LQALDASGFTKEITQRIIIKTFVPAMHRTVLIVIRNADQVGKLIAPNLTTGFGCTTRAAVKHSIDQPASVD
jgi:hypothetical protein